MNPPPLILASTSSARRLVLANAGLSFESVAPEVDEAKIKAELGNASPHRVAKVLAERKACTVSQRRRSTLVIGADQVLSCDGRLFDKPGSIAEARANLQILRGRPHILISAVCVARDGEAVWHCDETASLTMHDFDEAFLDRYLQRAGDDVLTSVGSYRLEGLGAHLFRQIEGDYFTILGLPLMPLLPFLASHGIGLA